MANKKFSDLPAAVALAGADLLAIAQGGVSKSITGSVLLTFAGTTYYPIAGGDITGNVTIATNKILLNTDGTAAFVGFVQMPFLLNLYPDALTASAPVVAEFSHALTAGTAAANFGTAIDITMDSDTTTRQIGARISTIWTTATHATRTSRMRFFLANSATLTEVTRLDAVGGWSTYQNSLGAVTGDAMLLSNLTAAALGAQQYSPALRFTGFGWGTTAGTSQALDWRVSVATTQGATPTSSLIFASSLNGGAFATRGSLNDTGNFTATGSVVAGNTVTGALGVSSGLAITAGVTSLLGWTGRSSMTSPSNSRILMTDNAGTDFNRLQFGGTTSSFPSIQRSSAILVARLADDSADTAIRATAFNIGSSVLNLAFATYAAGTAYTLTNTNALVDFGTTDPTITITAAGTYVLTGSVKVDLVGATFAANQTVTILIRRTNNTAANITNSGSTWTVPITTTLTNTLAIIKLNQVHYVTANSNDVLEIWADVSAVPSAGSIQITAAHISAVRIA